MLKSIVWLCRLEAFAGAIRIVVSDLALPLSTARNPLRKSTFVLSDFASSIWWSPSFHKQTIMAARDSWRRGGATEAISRKIKSPYRFPNSTIVASPGDCIAPDPASIMDFVGRDVILLTNDGAEYEGCLDEFKPDTSTIVMRSVKPVRGDGAHVNDRRNGRGKSSPLSLHLSQIKSFKPKIQDGHQGSRGFSKSLSAARDDISSTSRNGVVFATDGDIASASKVDDRFTHERALQRFDDFHPLQNEKGGAVGELDDMSSTDKKRWDQFEENERLFGITTSFDEHEYTTKINTHDPNFHKRRAHAERLAAEIEGRESSNPHIREERGLPVLDTHGDEEDRYSGVRRQSAPGSEDSSAASKGPSRADKTAVQAKFGASSQRRSYAAAASAGRSKKSPPPLHNQSARYQQPAKSRVSTFARAGVSDAASQQVTSKPTVNKNSPAPGQPVSSGGNMNERRAWGTGQPQHGLRYIHVSEDISKNQSRNVSANSAKGTASSEPNSNERVDRQVSAHAKDATLDRNGSDATLVSGRAAEELASSKARTIGTSTEKAPKDGFGDQAKRTNSPGVASVSAADLPQRPHDDSRNENETGDTITTLSAIQDGGREVVLDENSKDARATVSSPASPPKSPGEGESSGPQAQTVSEIADSNAADANKRHSKPFKLNPNAAAFKFNPDAQEFHPSAAGSQDMGMMQTFSVDVQADQSARIPSAQVAAPSPHDYGIYAHDPAMVNLHGNPGAPIGAGIPTSMPFMHGHYNPASIQSYIPANMMHMGQQMVPMNQMAHASFQGMSRSPYAVPQQYQMGVGGGSSNPYASGAPFGVPVPTSAFGPPSNGSRPGGYISGAPNAYMMPQQHMQAQAIPTSQLPGSYMGYHHNGAGLGRGGGGGNRNRRGRGGHRGGHQNHSH